MARESSTSKKSTQGAIPFGHMIHDVVKVVEEGKKVNEKEVFLFTKKAAVLSNQKRRTPISRARRGAKKGKAKAKKS